MKRLMDYQAIIVDLDGTLYFQKPVRIAMIREMILHFWRLPEFLIIKKYRDLYEAGINEVNRFANLPANAPAIVDEWMIDRPQPYIAQNKDLELINLLLEVKEYGIPILVYSDYPVIKKLSALNFAPSNAYCSADTGCLKPDAAGLICILNNLNIVPQKCLIIGDRQDKDGMLATNMGADAIILSSSKQERINVYTMLVKELLF